MNRRCPLQVRSGAVVLPGGFLYKVVKMYKLMYKNQGGLYESWYNFNPVLATA